MRQTSATQRPLTGVLNLAKPSGCTSRDVVNQVQRLVRPNKVGHAGTLDPLATGVLVVCVGSATRLISEIQAGRKRYRATFRLGCVSDTDDVTGVVSPAGDPFAVTREQVAAELQSFIGRVEQLPPQFSAVHVQGERAYDRARRGEVVELTPRLVEIDAIELRSWAPPEFCVDVTCGGGTYIRSIGRDLGQRLQCGAIMVALERQAVGPFVLADAVAPATLTAETLPHHLLPPAAAVPHLLRLELDSAEVAAVRQGRRVTIAAGRGAVTDRCALFDPAGRLVGIAERLPESSDLQPRIVLPDEPQ